MKKHLLDPLIVGGFVSSLFLGILNPFYVSLILSVLSVRVISVGSFLASGLPFLVGLCLEDKGLYGKLYAVLPAVMAGEVVCMVISVVLCRYGLGVYYLICMAVFGLFGTTVMYLMQRLKEGRYSGRRAVFERRYGMADALGYLVGSLLVFSGLVEIRHEYCLLALTVLQTGMVYGIFLLAYRGIRK